MKYLWVFMFVTVILGCSEIVPGTCYENPAGGAGGAGSMPIGAGVGATTSGDYAGPPKAPLDHGDGVDGFGDVPPRQPQEATNPPPECNIVTQSPCNEKCEADYESAAIVCGKIENEAQRRTCQDDAYARYKRCRGNCQTANKKNCTDMFVACQDKGKPCTRRIEGKTTLCEICRTDCQADQPYHYDECYKCGFK